MKRSNTHPARVRCWHWWFWLLVWLVLLWLFRRFLAQPGRGEKQAAPSMSEEHLSSGGKEPATAPVPTLTASPASQDSSPSSSTKVGPHDDLTQTSGIGPAFAGKLAQAGIHNFAQLATLSDEELQDILQLARFQRPDFNSWRTQASALATSPAIDEDDLTRVDGIGPAYASKLKAGGISTFVALAQASPEELDNILQIPEWRQPDYRHWIEQAKILSGSN